MSTDPDKATGCPIESDKNVTAELGERGDNNSGFSDEGKEKKKIPRSVRFPGEDLIVTQYFEPANPWHDVPSTTKSQLAAEYLEACRRHNTPCIDSVLQQIRELPENTIGGALRAPRLTLAECSLSGPAPADALEAVMRKVQFRRLEVEHATIDDEGAEALFDMIEYYESATTVSIAGPRQFGIRGWQAASRMIKKSADLSELEVTDAPLEASHAPVLARSLRAHTCTLRALCLQRVNLCGEPLLCLVIALKSNSSIRELRLGDNGLSVSDASQIASLLRYNTRIQLLDLSNNQIQDAGTAHLADALAEQASQSPPSAAASPLSPHRCQVGGHEARGLAFLVLWNNQLTRNCAPYLSKALRSSQSLCVLNVGRNALGNEAIRALGRGGALVSLGLQAARLGADAAAAIADLIRADTKLQRLDLRENRLGGAGLSTILAAMKENSTLTQIDLDEPPVRLHDSASLSAEDSETAYIRRVTREIRAACRRNEPPSRHDEDPHPVHRKISLTCHTACLLRVTRVTPERDSSTDSSGSTSSSSTPTRLAYCPPSRFRVVQVMEPPQIQVHPVASQSRKSPSRFSVTRNYDSVYNSNPTPPNSPAQPAMYTQLQNEVVTQLKNEALTQSKNEVVTQLRHQGVVKCEPVSNESVSLVKSDVMAQLGHDTQTKNENLLDNIPVQVKNEVHTQDKTENTKIKNEPLLTENTEVKNEPTVKRVITTQVRKEAMKLSKIESSNPVESQPTIQVENKVTVQPEIRPVETTQVKIEPEIEVKNEASAQLSKIEPKIEIKNETDAQLPCRETTVKNNVTTQIQHDVTQLKNEPAQLNNECLTQLQNVPATQAKIEPTEPKPESVTTVKNVVTTQIQNEPTLVKIESPIQAKNDPGSQASANVASTCQTNDTQAQSKSVESAIQAKNNSITQLEIKSATQPSNILVECASENIKPFMETKTDTVTQFNTESVTQLRNAPIESTNQMNIDVNQVKSTTIEPLIQAKNRGTQPITIESVEQYVEPVIQARNETATQFKIEPTTQVKNIVLESISLTNIDDNQGKSTSIDPVIQVKNSADTQLKSELTTQLENIPVEPISQTSKDIRKAKITSVEPVIQAQTPIKAEFITQSQNVPIEPTSKLKVEPVSLIQIKPDTQLKTELPIQIESSNPNKQASIDSKTQLRDLIETSSKIKTSPSHSILPKTSIATIEESPECEETELFDSTASSITQLKSTDTATCDNSKTKSNVECIPATKSDTIVEHAGWDLKMNVEPKNQKSDLPKPNTELTDSKKTGSTDLKLSVEPNKIIDTIASNVEQCTDPTMKPEPLTDSTKLKTSVESSTQLKNVPQKSDTQLKSDELSLKNDSTSDTKTKTDSNVIDISIKPTLVTCELKYSDVLKSDKKINTFDIKTKVFSNQKTDSLNKIVTITEDLGIIINEMRVLVNNKHSIDNIVPADSVILKKNKSESSLDSPDLEVSRLMENRREERSVFDSNSSLEISGSSMESLNEQNRTVQELDRRKSGIILSNESSMESTSEVTPVNSGNFLNLSLSSNESVSPIFGKTKLIHDSLSSLEASVSSLDSAKQDRIMVTSADSGIEYSLQHPSENREDNSSNEGTLTNNSSLKETVKKSEGFQLVDSLTSSPKRTSSLLDVPALKNKGIDRMRKISWVAPSSSFHIPRPEEKEAKPSHLEKLLSLFQHPSSIFSRSLTSDDEKKSASNTPPRKDSSLTSSFWSWGSTIEREREEDSSEATDSTLSERVQVSFVDESFSRKLDSKTPSTDTDNTLSEFQSFPTQESESAEETVTKTTEDIIVQNLDLSVISNTKRDVVKSDKRTDDLVRDSGQEKEEKELARSRSFAAVLKTSGSENSLDKQNSPDNGPSVDKLPSKVIRGIKENISPENTLTSSMTNTKALAVELERQVKNPTVNVWDVTLKSEPKIEEVKIQSDLAPIATIEETLDDDNPLQLAFIDDVKLDSDLSIESRVTIESDKTLKSTEGIDLGKDALSYLIYENRDFEIGAENIVQTSAQQGSLAEELKEAEIKEILDLSPELVVDDSLQDNVFTAKEIIGLRTSPIIPERAKLKKSNSLEDLSQLTDEKSPKAKTIAFKVPESTTPRDIPERRSKLRTRSGSSPKSLPESLNKPCPLTKMESILTKKKKKVSSLGKMARDSLLALNMSEDEIAEFRRSYKLTSVESLKSLESVSESGNSVDSRCRACLRQSQESLMSLDSISEDCRCTEECDRPGKSAR